MSLKPLIQRNDFNVIGQFLIKELSKELIFQKHQASGKLIDSLEYRIKNTSNGMRLEIWSEDYGHYVNTGRKAGTKKVPIVSLVNWIKQKGIASGDKEVTSIAYAIQTKIFREGIPTSGSKRLSARRTKWVDYTVDQTQRHIFDLFEKKVQDNIRSQINDQFAKANTELKATR